MDQYIIEMNDIVKSFGPVQAVKKSSFNLKKGEIHSLIGENGAGKSTMMKLLYGMHPLNAGTIKIKGEKVDNITPSLAISKGIGMVHQEFMLVDELTVLENIILGFEPKNRFTIDFQKQELKYKSILMIIIWMCSLTRKLSRFQLGKLKELR